jgi:hypothetical protein
MSVTQLAFNPESSIILPRFVKGLCSELSSKLISELSSDPG